MAQNVLLIIYKLGEWYMYIAHKGHVQRMGDSSEVGKMDPSICDKQLLKP